MLFKGMDRRAYPRRKVTLEIRLRSIEDRFTDHALIRDISEGGSFVETSKKYSLGSVVDFEIVLQGGVGLVKGQAKVVREARGIINGIGIQFLNLNDLDKKRIRNIVKGV